ncbi:ArsR/SmtB family transcription factor [Paenibacillus medicaginis]|uniref:ArsR/SmtB family transcription factor n=1 Tax=Paenibacillus medicaginis TaxID=1470560 RepID=A0ABV5BZ46_9BACL
MDTTTFSALAEPNRLHIVELLRNGPLTVGEIADQVGIRQPQASKHLRVLLDAGLVDVRVVANRRIYRLQQEPFRELNEWLETYKALWDERFDNLERYLKELQAKDKPSKE